MLCCRVDPDSEAAHLRWTCICLADPPIEPELYILEREVERLRTTVGNSLDVEEFIRLNGLTGTEIYELARANLRIQAYLNQRFGTTVYVTE